MCHTAASLGRSMKDRYFHYSPLFCTAQEGGWLPGWCAMGFSYYLLYSGLPMGVSASNVTMRPLIFDKSCNFLTNHAFFHRFLVLGIFWHVAALPILPQS
eukprot:jgi/Botrbrau1/584/Bobra.0010s0050.1